MLIFDHKDRTWVEYWYIVTTIDKGGDLSLQTQNLMTREQLIHRSSDNKLWRLKCVFGRISRRFGRSRGQRGRCGGTGGTPRSLRRQEEREIGLEWFVKLSVSQFCRFWIHTTTNAITIPRHEISPASTRGVRRGAWRATNKT